MAQIRIPTSRPWGAAAGWMVFLGPFFFAVYGFCNWISARLSDVPSFFFAWETRIPFVPELMLPYMSIDAFFAASVFVCATRHELDRHARRIVAAILVSAAGFLLFPLKFSFERPAVEGFNGWLLTILTGFDKPYNQAPSLHISLLVVLWVIYARHARGWWQPALHAWFGLIAVSVVLVYQHHVIDVIAGFWAGVVCLYVFPDRPWSTTRLHLTPERTRRHLGLRYAFGGVLCLAAALTWGGLGWWLLWPAVALLLVASGYLMLGVDVFQKQGGRLSWAARWLLAPYRLGAWLSYLYYTRNAPAYVEVAPQVFIGRLPRRSETKQRHWHAVIDFTAEFSSPHAGGPSHYFNLPTLDLVTMDVPLLRQAADIVERERRHGPVLVHCALGLSRSATAIMVWLWRSHLASDQNTALHMLKEKWPQLVLHATHLDAVARAAHE